MSNTADIWYELDKMNTHLGMIVEYLRVIAEKGRD